MCFILTEPLRQVLLLTPFMEEEAEAWKGYTGGLLTFALKH